VDENKQVLRASSITQSRWDNTITDGHFVAALRLTKLTTQELADGLGVSTPTIRRWRNGRNLPFWSMRSAILYFLESHTKDRRRSGVVNEIQRAAFTATEGLNPKGPTWL
jgi:transcriptional regulator with XRE-family HTH domain